MQTPATDSSTLKQTSFCVQVVDDHHMMRLGLIALAQASATLPIAWLEAGNLGDAMDVHRQGQRVDLVLLDLNLPDSQGLQGLRSFLREFPKLHIAVFSATEDQFVMEQAMGLGAVGYLPKSGTAHNTLRLIESLLNCAPVVANRSAGEKPDMPRSMGAPDALQQRAATLNATQLQVLDRVLAGMSNQEIATSCNLALGTVKNAVSTIFLTLDVQSRAHLMSVFR